MRLQVVRTVYEDAEGIGPEDVISFEEAARLLGIKSWKLRQLVDDEELTMLIDADSPKGWAWRWLLLRSEVEALAESERPAPRHRPPFRPDSGRVQGVGDDHRGQARSDRARGTESSAGNADI